MSRPRHWWWASVRSAIRQYPALLAKKNELQAMQVTKAVKSIKGRGGELHDFYATPGGGGNGRTVERLALAELPDARLGIEEIKALRHTVPDFVGQHAFILGFVGEFAPVHRDAPLRQGDRPERAHGKIVNLDPIVRRDAVKLLQRHGSRLALCARLTRM